MNNTSGLDPLGHAVLVEPYEPEIKSSVLHIPEHVRQNTRIHDQRARVVAVGSECWLDERQPRAKPGDLVMIARLAGTLMQGPADGKAYRMVNGADIFARITEELK